MISVICPTYNEAKNIESLIKFFLKAKPEDKELIIIDGESTDNTVQIVNKYVKNYKNIFLLNNPYRYVPFALNMGIKKSKGDFIIRLDAHSIYSINYFEKILETFEKTNADIVGGPYLIAKGTEFQRAVGFAISSPFGTGNSKAHDPNFEGYVDSVPYGAWGKKLFEEIGYFDERFKRNQDDEFHYRANSFGKKVYLSPEIKFWYYPRNSFSGLIRQYFEYGVYKPLVLKKINSGLKLRHLAPSFLTIYLILTIIFFKTSLFWLFPILIYFLIVLIFSLKVRDNIKVKLYSLVIFPAVHLSYGAGFLLGIFRIKKLSKHQILKT